MSSPIAIADKDPDSTRWFGFDWSPWLDSAIVLASSEWEITPNDSTISIVQEQYGDTGTRVLIAGGTVDTSYNVENTVTNSDGETEQWSFCLIVREH